MTAQYGNLEYWEERYRKDSEPFDWFQKYHSLKPIIQEAGLQTSDSILMIGCGTSRMSEELYDDGFQDITNIDFSPVCINIVESRCASKPGMKFQVLNVLDMKQLNEQYDFIVDKGTLDCILCGDKSFDNAELMLTQVSQHLKPNGTYMLISYGAPNFRLNHLQKSEMGWTVTMRTVQKPPINIQAPGDDSANVHYIYICKKNGEGVVMTDKMPNNNNNNAADGSPTDGQSA